MNLTIVQKVDRIFGYLVEHDLTPGIIVMNPKFYDELVRDSTIRLSTNSNGLMFSGLPVIIDKNVKSWAVIPKEWMICYDDLLKREVRMDEDESK